MGTDRLEAKIINTIIVFIILARGQAVQTGVDNPSKLQGTGAGDTPRFVFRDGI